MPKTKITAEEKLLKLTVKELRAEAIKLGMPESGANNFETKKPLISTILTLRAKQVVETPGQLKKEKEKYTSKKERMMKILMGQPSVRILVPCAPNEKPGVDKWVYNELLGRKEQFLVSGAYTPVQINGAKWMVMHGSYRETPKQVADMIGEAQRVTSEVGKEWLIDRDDPKTGKPVRDKLE